MKSNFILRSMLILAVICMPFIFSSCDDDDEEIFNITYSIGFDEMHSDGLVEMVQIEKIFRENLGAAKSTFVLTGTIKECDQKVIEGCNKAMDEINNMSIKGTYVLVVTNNNTGSRVFTTHIPTDI